MSKITSDNVYLQIKKDSVGGHKKPVVTKAKELKELNETIKKDKMTQDDMIIMEQYAQYLPSGKRQLKLNMSELRDTVLSNDLLKKPLTKTSGNNKGGNISLKMKTQGEYISDTIENKNRLRSNPNYTSFKNNFII